MAAVVDFTPTRLIAVRERVQEIHPGTATSPPNLGGAAMNDLRNRISEAAGDTAALARLAESLSPREVRGALGGLQRWEDLRTACAIIVRHRASARHLPLLWAGWQRFPVLEPLRELLFEFGKRFSWERAVAAPYVEAAPVWVAYPGAGLQRWLDDQAMSASDLGDLTGQPVDPDSPLGRLVREYVLTQGSGYQLRVDAQYLEEWQAELGPEDAILFGRNYLTKLQDREWARSMLDIIRDRFGTPKKPTVDRFWEPLPDSIKNAFQRQYIEARIREELGHDHERELFWNRWAYEIADLTKGWAGTVRYAELEFENFVVVEFFETGNAAYFYTAKDAPAVRRDRVGSPAALKRKVYYPFLYGSDNRLIHAPRGRWTGKADTLVRTWLRKTKRR